MRAKFVVELITNFTGGNTFVSLVPVTDGSDENKDFWSYTPIGKLEMTITNKAATQFFTPGNEYYLDVTDADADADSVIGNDTSTSTAS